MADRKLSENVPLFSSLPVVEIDVLAATLESQSLRDGAILFREGEPGESLYIMLGGGVEIVKALGSDAERVLALSGPGDLIGEMSLLEPGEHRSASARVRNSAEVVEMRREDFEKLIARYPKLSFELLRILADRLRMADNAVIRELREKNRQLQEANAELLAAQHHTH